MSDNETTRDGSSPFVRFLKAHLVTIVLVVLVAIFIGQNTRETTLDFLWLSFDAALWLVLLVTTVVGFLIGALAARRRARRS